MQINRKRKTSNSKDRRKFRPVKGKIKHGSNWSNKDCYFVETNFVFNPGQNIWNKVKISTKVGQE